MAKRKSSGRKPTAKKGKKVKRAARSAKRPSKGRTASRKPAPKARRTAARRKPAKRAARKPPAKVALIRSAPARLARERRTLDDLVPTPPSSLDMARHGSAARTGRAEMAESRANRASLTPDISAGDVDVNVEDAYFVG